MHYPISVFGFLFLSISSVATADDDTLWDQLDEESRSESSPDKSKKSDKNKDSKTDKSRLKKTLPAPIKRLPTPMPALIEEVPKLTPQSPSTSGKVIEQLVPTSRPINQNTAIIKEVEEPIFQPPEPQIIYIEPPPTTEELVRLIPKQSFDLPMAYHERVIYWTEWFRGPGRHTLSKWREQSKRYKALIRPILKKADAPLDLFYLPMVESGFNPLAESPVGAVGLWQFMPATARRYGLIVNSDVDERKDPIKSTVAAVRLLKRLRLDLGYWHVAMAAYNSGPGRVSEAMRKHGTASFWTLADEDSLPEETRDYVPKILAAMILDKHPERFDLSQSPKSLPFERAHYELKQLKTVFALAKAANMKEVDFREYNPHLLSDRVPASDRKGITIYLPKERLSRFVEIVKKPSRGRVSSGRTLRQDEIDKSKKPSVKDTLHHAKKHRVKPGETLQGIAALRGITVELLKKYNDVDDTSDLKPGDVLRLIPPPKRIWVSVELKKGESLKSLAKRYDCTPKDLRRWNGLSESDNPEVGRLIWLKRPKK